MASRRRRKPPSGFDWREAGYVAAVMLAAAFLLIGLWFVSGAGSHPSLSPECVMAYWNCGR